jgi:nucleotide-binding universal stress UspA family protein
MEEIKSILYPVALTEISPKVAPYIVTMARQLDARVYLMHVVRPFNWFADNFMTELSEPESKRIARDFDPRLHSLINLLSESNFKHIAGDFESQVHNQAQQKLEAFKNQYLSEVSIADAVVVSGTRHKQILDYAESKGIDLIIMGAETSLQKVMFGSVVEKVSRLATVPVMIVKCF